MAIPFPASFVLQQSLLREWIRAARYGDTAAFEQIVLLHERLVLRFAHRLLLNPEDAKDAAQEVFLRLHRTLGRFQDEQEFVPWLYRITVNVSLDIARDLARRGGSRNLPIDHAFAAPDSSPNPEQALLRTQQHSLVLAALGQLSERERAAVVLRDLEGRTTVETAQILGSSEATVRSQISTGRAKIKSLIASRLEPRLRAKS